MLAPLLMYGLPAALGGYAAYKQSGGNLGAGLLGAGLSAGGIKGLRMAGTALGELPMISGGLGRAASSLTGTAANLAGRGAAMEAVTDAPGLAGLAARTGLAGRDAGVAGLSKLAKVATPVGIGAAAAGLGGMVMPNIAGNIAAGAAGPINAAGGGLLGAAGAMGVPGLGAGPVPRAGVDGNPLPPGLDPTYGYQPWGTYTQAVNPLSEFNAGRLMEAKEADTQARNMNLMLGTMKPWTDAAKKEDLARNLYAMTVKNNQLTQSNALLGGLQAARQMGATSAQQAGAALTNQYQYV